MTRIRSGSSAAAATDHRGAVDISRGTPVTMTEGGAPVGVIDRTASAAVPCAGANRRLDRVGAGLPRSSYRHEALLWRGDEEFLAGTVPFIRDGLSAKQPVMVAVIAPHITLLEAALGTDADRVHFVDMAVIGHNPARIIPAWLEFVNENGLGGQPMRGIGEPIWPGRRPVEVSECQLHEGLLNIAIEAKTPLWLLCPYDAAKLGEDVITEAMRSHKTLNERLEQQLSDTYGADSHVRMLFEKDLPAVRIVASHRTFGRDFLPGLREEVSRHALRAGVSQERSADLALAVHEVALNSIQHGAGARVRRIWLAEDSLVCEIRDGGQVKDPLIGRRVPPGGERGWGLWMANQLSDLIQIRSNAAGTTIRIHTWLH